MNLTSLMGGNAWEEYCLPDEPEEPEINDAVLCCPDCDRPNQFGEVCPQCQRNRDEEAESEMAEFSL